ncbi:MAG: hypothetical protein JST68_22460 [Bacteroidetes bacterium]|nr:hypothetical protein [Bacteroidota bacterium]
MSSKLYLTLSALLFSLVLLGQSQQYAVFNRTLSIEGDRIHLDAKKGMGVAWVKGMSFSTGTIEFDVKGKDVLQQSFVGVAFHGLNDSTYEAIYFRPFNFRSTDEVRKVHAVQYIAQPEYHWELLRTKFPGKYEKGISPAPDPNEWFHVKVVVGDKKVEVFVNGQGTYSLLVEPTLVNERGRMLGFWVGEGSDGDWKNLKVK